MNIAAMLDLLRKDPKSFHILGKGAHCLGLTHHSIPDAVLLLEKIPGGKDGSPSSGRSSPQHARAVGFARQSDELLASSLSSYRNQKGRSFVHPILLDSASPQLVKEDIYLHIGGGKIFAGHSARLVRRIPGQALHYLDFVDRQTGLNATKLNSLAQDIASWMYTLHHEISVGAMVKNKVAKQFKDTGRSLLDRPLSSEKFRVFVDRNLAEIKTLSAGLAGHTLHKDYEHIILTNMEDAGVDFALLEQSAALLDKQLRKLLPHDRIGLSHTDLHPGNIIVSKELDAVNGICDWMSAGIDAQSVDFAGLGFARGLLPKVMKVYCKREKDSQVAHPINPESVYAYAAMRNIYNTVKSVKNGFGSGCAARIAWEQTGECFAELSRINSELYGPLARRYKRQNLPPVRLPPERHTFKSHPSVASMQAR